MSSIPYTVPLPGGIPSTHNPHTEQKTTILVPKENTAFLNPVQEYNRDLSVACIRAWNEERKERFMERQEAKARKGKNKAKVNGTEVADGEGAAEQPVAGPSTEVGTRDIRANHST